jgi:hypothetical protein
VNAKHNDNNKYWRKFWVEFSNVGSNIDGFVGDYWSFVVAGKTGLGMGIGHAGWGVKFIREVFVGRS